MAKRNFGHPDFRRNLIDLIKWIARTCVMYRAALEQSHD